MSPTDNSTNSPHHFYGKSIGTANENLNFDIKVKGLSIQETKGKLLEGKKDQPTIRAKLF